MEKKGINIIWNEVIERIEKVDAGLDVTLSNGDVKQYDQVLYAIGRVPNTRSMGLEEASSRPILRVLGTRPIAYRT